jgi:hypothetical protein
MLAGSLTAALSLFLSKTGNSKNNTDRTHVV